MGRGAVGPPTSYSRLVATNIERLRIDAGLSVAQLTSAAGLSRSYYQSRVRLESPFNTNDIEALALALGVTPYVLSAPEDPTDPMVRVDARTVGDRIRLILQSESLSVEEFEASNTRLDGDQLSSLLHGQGSVVVPEASLTRLAEQFGIDADYLISPQVRSITEQVEAELELRAALSSVGAKSLHMRAVGDLTPAALRAIARSLREIDDA